MVVNKDENRRRISSGSSSQENTDEGEAKIGREKRDRFRAFYKI